MNQQETQRRTVPFQVRLTPRELERLRKIAGPQGVAVSVVIRRAIAQYKDPYTTETEPTAEAVEAK